MKALQIDASHGEGGGQLVRLAMALAAITGRAIHLTHIRARRARPGLAAQHLAALRAVADMCGGALEGAALGAGEVSFRPGPIRGGNYRFEVGTAGSVSLVLQAVLPVALHADGPSRIAIVGGTDVKLAPPVDYLRMVFLPWLEEMGIRLRVALVRHGYYPRGGGELTLDVSHPALQGRGFLATSLSGACGPCSQLRLANPAINGGACARPVVTPARRLGPLRAESRGAVREIVGRAHVAHLPRHIAERMANAARAQLTDLAPLRIDVDVLGDEAAVGAGGALVLAASTQGGRLGAAVVAQRGVSAERLGEAAGRALRADLQSGAGVDIHAADQLLVYAALAEGESRYTVREVSLHAETAMWLIEQFLPVRFRVHRHENGACIDVLHGR
jgi:RNA 3'-terminal phosphate cyclase (ATP)